MNDLIADKSALKMETLFIRSKTAQNTKKNGVEATSLAANLRKRLEDGLKQSAANKFAAEVPQVYKNISSEPKVYSYAIMYISTITYVYKYIYV